MKRKLALFITLALAALLLLTACSGAKFGLHKVTFDADGGELGFFEGSKTVQTYGTVDLPTPTKEGYVFEGWFIGEGVNEDQFTATSMVTSDITLKAKWRKAEYTVTFLDYYGNVISRETVKHGEAANAPVVPRIAEEKLRFDSWDTDFAVITGDLEVKALYAIDSYTITYVTNNSQTIPDVSYFFDETPVAPPQPGLGGHYFIGWYLDEAFTTEYHFDAPLTEDITLYAYFKESIPIETLDELLAIPEYSDNKYFLKNDIDCEGTVITTSIVGFTGVLDGEGHRIYNFVYQPVAAANSGIFATNGGIIKNLVFDNFSYTLTNTNINSNTGFLVGTNSGTIENIQISNASLSFTHLQSGGGTTTSNYGIIAGENKNTVTDCEITSSTLYVASNAGSWWNGGGAYSILYSSAIVGLNNGEIATSNTDIVTTLELNNTGGSNYPGHISLYYSGISSINNGSIYNCHAVVNAIGSTNDHRDMKYYIGGLVQANNIDGHIENCSADTTITLNGTTSLATVGGLLENNAGNIKNCYSDVNITNVNSTSRFGGFVSQNSGGIVNCYAYGDMNVGAATAGKGGFAGYNNGSINSCFADVNITATDATLYGPFVGNTDTASYITNSYYSNKGIFITNGAPQIFDVTYAEATDPLNLTDKDFIIGTLGWSENVWECDPNKFNHPTLK